MRVLITGATGLVGKALVKKCLEQGIAVNYLTTRVSKIEGTAFYKGFLWNPASNEIDINCFEGCDAIINLAGASVSKRWTPAYKQEILESRLDILETLKRGLEKVEDHTIKQLISASAIGFYPDSETAYYKEDHDTAGTSFLAQVTEKWEAAIDSLLPLGVQITKVRIGIVLAEEGGALQKMVPPIKYLVGAPFGSGNQWQSWIHIDDLTDMLLFLIHKEITGIFNAVAPNPVTNMKMVKAIGKQLGVPVFLPNIPRFVMRLVLGEMHTLVFMSQRVSSKKIESLGFHFEYVNLEKALSNLL
ncbi:TIGR01777 family oxidoreductase [Spongiivirga citrea]|uniref:TIGR01777 family protein n=1 Tax=Spongiivirga citrea TaxID=1481457 RepID=A0A6M0CNN8_9FLAO|nr:TIGR01777 family oxidoreductase [Spongiivirga citrea]NER18563.1 TIGR01777 family protein [Spongiivirga citrea]